jgi:hypothetical protein
VDLARQVYFRETSPRIDGFAEKGILFERALASMASTYPSHLWGARRSTWGVWIFSCP